MDDDKYQWAYTLARYLVYFLTLQGTKGLSVFAYDMFHNKRVLDIGFIRSINRVQLTLYLVSIAILVSNNQKFIAEDFPLIFIACLIVEYPEIDKKSSLPIRYGAGMACIFYEGYLVNVIPPDGSNFGGLEQNITNFESSNGIVVPVKKLFIVITKSLYCPPDLQQFNKPNRNDLAKLESCRSLPCELPVDDAMFQSLEDVEKSVAGVKNRIYRNSMYKIYRPRGRPVYLVAECATPLNTLHRAMQNTDLHEDWSGVNVEEISNDFCSMLTTILSKSSECKDKVELVYFDDTDPQSNLADVLLDRISVLECNFEELISTAL